MHRVLAFLLALSAPLVEEVCSYYNVFLGERNKIMDDVDLARELIILKAKDLGMDDESLNELDEVVCNILGIKDADPFIWPS
tara:strand:- start:1749 stop:1994 length:246 start_codon:yes stop_codon:yes gene_type:complete